MSTVTEVPEPQLPLEPPAPEPVLFVLVVCQRCRRQLHKYVTGRRVPAFEHDCDADKPFKVKR